MPFRRQLYPDDWEAIVAAVRARSGDKCERCGAVNGERGAFDPAAGKWEPLRVWVDRTIAAGGQCEVIPNHPRHFPRVVLTTAHQDYAGGPCRCEEATGRKCGVLEHLACLCARCHLALDLPRHLMNAARTRRQKALQRQPELFSLP